MIRISKLARSIQPSATLAAGAKARELRQSGVTVYDFSLGEPDFDTPAHICDAAIQAMKTGQTHYTPSAGTAEVRKTIAQWYGRYHGLTVGPENVIVSNGAKHSLHNALAATVSPGDEVIIPAPCWVSYSDLVKMTGATPILVATTQAAGFKMSPAQLQAAITPQTRMLMLNSPSNPTGATYTRTEIEALLAVLAPTEITILSDEIYEQLIYSGDKATCVATINPALRDRIITVSGASKSYAMTGWRMGWAIAPAAVVKAMDTIQSQETSCPSSVSQAAVIAALSGPQDCVSMMRQEFARRRDFVTQSLARIPGIKYFPPEGAFYAFFGIDHYIGQTFSGRKVVDSATFCTLALEQAHVNLIAGSAFGTEGFVRMSFATSEDVLRAGLTCFADWVATAKPH